MSNSFGAHSTTDEVLAGVELTGSAFWLPASHQAWSLNQSILRIRLKGCATNGSSTSTLLSLSRLSLCWSHALGFLISGEGGLQPAG
ncbi:hypothetical protein [Dickeya chrysanthemi]|uniref:hypothetical protein n=1 Tax=Dickeya chrysanthemi TaxID=556 RepID=UPI003F699B94